MRNRASSLLIAAALLGSVAVLASVRIGDDRAAAARQTPPSTGDRLEQAYRVNNTGVAHLEQFDYSGAEKLFREALQIQPDLAIARLNLAIALLYAGQSDAALVEARAAAKSLPDSPSAHFVLGLAARAEDELAEAEPAFRRVLEIDPADSGARIHLGQVYLQQRQFDQALPLFREALETEPHNVTAAYNVALALTRAGQAEESRKAMEAFEQLRDSAYGVTYSQVYLGQGRYGEAVASTGAEPALVDEAAPKVTFVDATASILPAQAAAPPAAPTGRLLLFDANDDGALDLLVTGPGSPRLLLNEKGRFIEASARLGTIPAGSAGGAIAGDYDNDGRTDLLLLRESGYLLLRQGTDGTFENISGKALPASTLRASTATFSDLDHDGDLDIVAAGATVQVLRNNGDGSFADITATAGLGAIDAPAAGLASIDFDNRRDVDILLMPGDGAPLFFRNMRDGSFRSTPAGLPAAARYTALAIADFTKDRFTDLFFGREGAPGVFAISDGRGGFNVEDAPEGTRGAVAAQFLDYDNDGLPDLVTLAAAGARLHRNLGSRWVDVTKDAGLDRLAPVAGAFTALAAGDLTGNGARDLVVQLSTGDLQVWRNEPAAPHRALPVRLSGRISNRSGLGSRVEIRAGSLHQMLDAASSTPAVTPADLVFGLGSRPSADVVRVLWPSGILQAETGVPPSPPGAPAAFVVEELDRKPSSCPYLFTWNGSRFEFVTDFMGGGEMGAWLAPAVWNDPDPDEYVRISADQLQPRDGRYELRVTNELEEALFVDRLQLIAVDHPAGTEVYPNEGLRSAPRPPFSLTAARGARPPVTATDGTGRDVRTLIAELDRRYADTFTTLPIRGYAEPHELILDLGQVSDAVLLLTGWTDYAFSNDNVAASQSGTAMRPPFLQVKDERGAWTTAIEEIGFPVGRPQTVVVDLAGRFPASSREVRILTNMRIYWDQILVAERHSERPKLTRLEPLTADLRWRGFSAEITPDGKEPYGYDYHRVSSASPWKALVGRYTRQGDVRPLLRRVDDMFVVSKPGDELALSFRALPPVPPGRARTFLLYSFGYSKEMNPRSASPDTVAPLPFRAMSGYPYGADEHYPRTRRHRQYQEQWNTRVVSRSVPPIDVHTRREP